MLRNSARATEIDTFDHVRTRGLRWRWRNWFKRIFAILLWLRWLGLELRSRGVLRLRK